MIEIIKNYTEANRTGGDKISACFHKQLLHPEELESFTELCRTNQEYYDSCEISLGVRKKLAVNESAYVELAVKLSEFHIERLVSSHPVAVSRAYDSICSASSHKVCGLYGPKIQLLNSKIMRTMIIHPFRILRICWPLKRKELTFTIQSLLPGKL